MLAIARSGIKDLLLAVNHMQCLKCKGKVESDWVFCPNCGKPRALMTPPLSDSNVDAVFDAMMKKGALASTSPVRDKLQDNVLAFESKMSVQEQAGLTCGVRSQVFEVIVRQALAGAPWRAICQGPMQVNNISPDEIQAEVERRKALMKQDREKNFAQKNTASTSTSTSPSSPPAAPPTTASKNSVVTISRKPSTPAPSTSTNKLSSKQLIAKLRTDVIGLSVKLCEQEDLYTKCSEIILTIDKLNREISAAEMQFSTNESENILAQDLQRELDRVKRAIDSGGKEGSPQITS